MNNEAIGSIIRHVVVTAGGIMTAKGIGDDAMWQAIAGAAAAIAGFFILRKKKAE